MQATELHERDPARWTVHERRHLEYLDLLMSHVLIPDLPFHPEIFEIYLRAELPMQNGVDPMAPYLQFIDNIYRSGIETSVDRDSWLFMRVNRSFPCPPETYRKKVVQPVKWFHDPHLEMVKLICRDRWNYRPQDLAESRGQVEWEEPKYDLPPAAPTAQVVALGPVHHVVPPPALAPMAAVAAAIVAVADDQLSPAPVPVAAVASAHAPVAPVLANPDVAAAAEAENDLLALVANEQDNDDDGSAENRLVVAEEEDGPLPSPDGEDDNDSDDFFPGPSKSNEEEDEEDHPTLQRNPKRPLKTYPPASQRKSARLSTAASAQSNYDDNAEYDSEDDHRADPKDTLAGITLFNQ